AGVLADAAPDALPQRLVQGETVAQADEQDDPLVRARGGADALPDRQALEHLRQLVHLAVNLGRTDTDAAGVERRVAAPVNDQPAVLGDLRSEEHTSELQSPDHIV